jgi:hypothetical protein
MRDQGLDNGGFGGTEIEGLGQAARGSDASGAIRIDDRVLFGLGEVFEPGRTGSVGRRLGGGDRGITEPIAGAFHGGGMHCCLSFLACHLVPAKHAQPALHMAHHDGGASVTAADFLG